MLCPFRPKGLIGAARGGRGNLKDRGAYRGGEKALSQVKRVLGQEGVMGEFLDRSRVVLQAVAQVGKGHHARPDITRVEPFKGYLRGAELDTGALDERDGGV